ncbi:MAG: ABC transporter ATP-binding protein [Chlamydiia bacterium]
MFVVENLKKSYEGRTLFSEVFLKIAQGKKIAIIGRSGSGKTTLLNILGLLDTADAGTLTYKEILVNENCHQIRNQNIGFIFQFHYLNPELTVLENLELPRLIQGNRLSKEEATLLLRKVDLEEKLYTTAKYLSGGEKQRIAFLRALVNNPEIILADEPTGQLDQAQAEELMQAILDLPQAVVLVTHDKEFASRMDERYELINQQLVPW